MTDVLGDQEVTGVQLRHRPTGKERVLPVQGLFIAIGHKPNTDLFTPWLKMDELGYLVTHPDTTCTDIPVYLHVEMLRTMCIGRP